jgi:hypothetical protein
LFIGYLVLDHETIQSAFNAWIQEQLLLNMKKYNFYRVKGFCNKGEMVLKLGYDICDASNPARLQTGKST